MTWDPTSSKRLKWADTHLVVFHEAPLMLADGSVATGSPVDHMVWPSRRFLLAWGRFQRTERWIAMLQPSSLNNAVFNQNFLKNWAAGKWASHCTSYMCPESRFFKYLWNTNTKKCVRSPLTWRLDCYSLAQDPDVDTFLSTRSWGRYRRL